MGTKAWLVGILVLISASVEAKTLYVDRATGSDSTTYAANGPSAPWASIGRAAWGSTSRSAPNSGQAARAGDVVIVRAGTYGTAGNDIRYDPIYNPVNSGSAGQPIVFQAEGTVVLTLTSRTGPVIGAYDVDYITWRGFTINEANARSHADTGPVVLSNTVGSTIDGCIIDGNGDPGYGDNHTGIRVQYARGITLRNNRITNVRTSVVNSTNGAGIQVYFSGDIVFEHNEISNSGSGIFLKAPADDDTGTGWVDRFTIRYNLISDVGVGIGVHRSPNTAQAPTLIYQNIVRNSTAGMRIWPFDGGASDPRNAKIVNNTITNNTIGIEIRGNLVNNAGHVIWNNIVASSSTYVLNFAGAVSNMSPTRVDFEHNLYWVYSPFAIVYSSEHQFAAWQSTYGQDQASPASLNADPRFVSAATGNYRLQAGSPAIGRGVDLLDLNNNGSTSDAVPLGAYVTGSETIGRLAAGSPSTPLAPANLRILTQ